MMTGLNDTIYNVNSIANCSMFDNIYNNILHGCPLENSFTTASKDDSLLSWFRQCINLSYIKS